MGCGRVLQVCNKDHEPAAASQLWHPSRVLRPLFGVSACWGLLTVRLDGCITQDQMRQGGGGKGHQAGWRVHVVLTLF